MSFKKEGFEQWIAEALAGLNAWIHWVWPKIPNPASCLSTRLGSGGTLTWRRGAGRAAGVVGMEDLEGPKAAGFWPGLCLEPLEGGSNAPQKCCPGRLCRPRPADQAGSLPRLWSAALSPR